MRAHASFGTHLHRRAARYFAIDMGASTERCPHLTAVEGSTRPFTED